jgi:ribonucleoside-diphosphate reductase alpha chain
MSAMHENVTAILRGPDQATDRERGLEFPRYFTQADKDPFSYIGEWELRAAVIHNEKGQAIFEQVGVEAPSRWSQTATNIVASKYFHGKTGTPERESSVRQLIARVVDTITEWGSAAGYFRTPGDADAFHDELTYLLVMQTASFNSPVWFNCGLWQKYGRSANGNGWFWNTDHRVAEQETEAYRHPQCSACFINSVEDSMESILRLVQTEGMLFKWGSGTGTNLSPLRSACEQVSGGGTASGPVSFMRGYDAFAGVIKSGGKTRRAAKMVMLNVDHPDILEFIECKAREEEKARALIAAGYDGSVDGAAYSSIAFQNANHSVRVHDEFMEAVLANADWTTKKVTSGDPATTHKAHELLKKMAESAWQCGDPGVQFDSEINRWNPCKGSGRINASNPCSEYMFLDDSACNLASLNLLKFLSSDGRFDIAGFRHAVRVMLVAQEILVDNSSYPTRKIAENSHDFRPLGLGYANLGALLMATGVPYDSQRARGYAAAITAVMHGQACLTSSEMAKQIGPFPKYERNRDSFLNVIALHQKCVGEIEGNDLNGTLVSEAESLWATCVERGRQYGFRNAQVTVLAPTGTIAFMMDCDTTGVEPDLALVKHKRLVGGGVIKVVNNTVPTALRRLGYSPEAINGIVDYINREGTIEGSGHIKSDDLPVFDCSLRASNGERFIHYMGHMRMMAAVQPFLSGAISKTINMPSTATVDEIASTYIEAWKLGLKSIAVYRDQSKKIQPLSAGQIATGPSDDTAGLNRDGGEVPPAAFRRRLPVERAAVVHHFSVGGQEGYLTVGLYDDGRPGEIFLRIAKEGSTVSGLMDAFATAISLNLQYGVSLSVLCEKFSHTRFEPSGWTGIPEIGYANSLTDYIFRWLELRFLKGQQQSLFVAGPREQDGKTPRPYQGGLLEGPTCTNCGAVMRRAGTCFVCECGASAGCG